jgi:hypothetical protein
MSERTWGANFKIGKKIYLILAFAAELEKKDEFLLFC